MLFRWTGLIGMSSLLSLALELVGVPAALLIGSIVAAVFFAVRDKGVAITPPLFVAAQALVGCLIAQSITPGIISMIARDWPLFASITVATIGFSVVLGLMLARYQVLPGTVAIWGSLPGMAAAIVLMARDSGEDYRLVAFMSYLRVLCVAVIASILVLALGGSVSHHVEWFPPIDPSRMAATVSVAAIGSLAGLKMRLPAGGLLGAAILGAGLNLAGLVHLDLPPWLLAVAYALIGWQIGLRFTRETVSQARYAFVRVMLSIALLIGFSSLGAWVLTKALGVDPVTAFLATSPGGMDSVAIIASTTRVDVPFVMALQAMRLITVLVLGPTLVRLVIRRFGTAKDASGA